MYKKSILWLSILITISPFIVLTILYNKIPDQIPAFMNIKGNPILFIPKNLITVFRLPMMGVMLQGICLTMLISKVVDSTDQHERLWLSASFLAAAKMSLTSIEIVIYQNPFLLNALRNIVLSIIIAAIISILFHLYSLYKNYPGTLSLYLSYVSPFQKKLVLSFATGYLFFVFLPFMK